MDGRDYGHTRSNTVDTVDSAATTLLASASSSQGHSFDEGKRYADLELAAWDAGGDVRKRRNTVDEEGFEQHDDDADEHEALLARSPDNSRRPSLQVDIAHTAQAVDEDGGEPPPPTKPQPVSWSSLPKKGQLTILTLARLSEPLTQTSLQSYMFYQLKSFVGPNGEVPTDAVVAQQAGMLAAAFTGAQFLTAMMWGRLADSEHFGRKRVILIGLLGTAVGSLGFGFSQSFGEAMFWRAIGGVLNGNIGVMRTMTSEIVKEKKYQSRAFLLLPMTFNVGVIIGPLLGGLLADPAGTYPELFGPGSTFGGEDGVWLFMRFPYALPNLINASFLVISTLALVLGLEETLEALRGKSDWGLKLGKLLRRAVQRGKRPQSEEYHSLAEHEGGLDDLELNASGSPTNTKPSSKTTPITKKKLPFRRIWTPNVLFTLLAHGLLAMHVGTFNNLWFVFLSTPRYNPDSKAGKLPLPSGYKPHAPFSFTGGLALPPPAIGTALAILGVIGISLQLLVFPRVSFWLGTIRSYRLSLLLFPVSYFLAPYLAIIPSTSTAPSQASGPLVWISITLILAIQVLARTFALPSTAILVNNASPHPSVLGTLHGIAQSVSSATRTVGPVLAGYVYGVGLEKGVVGMAWWGMAGVAVLGAFAGRWVKEGDGHEIWLEGEKEAEEERGKG
ncbi:Putative major facilitator superfamily, MFS transporter superfamily [Septoria linicola]|uniref:Major facilitator superfamily, MFS transporter superfamily n=1 Tax=Septoria linicola TaxID=215465 RepID=A0A9Q9ALW0_9PEZI|nr:putative major facilitator superfamily, MFS transporter superfamily [Septoria linicola]USW48508.1 Putative major facilitator superfamily, MFS transporter superfamily [Septoria linicola]